LGTTTTNGDDVKIYISSHDVQSANDLAEELTRAGHVVVSVWHFEAATNRLADMTGIWWKMRVAENFARIEQADVLVLIGGAERVTGGKYVEAGYAHATGVSVHNLGAVGNGMMHFAADANDMETLLAQLSEAERPRTMAERIAEL
jgi:hypothetical protein